MNIFNLLKTSSITPKNIRFFNQIKARLSMSLNCTII